MQLEHNQGTNKTAISFIGLTREKWQIAKDEDFKNETEAKTKGLFKNSLVITDTITSTNTIFWLKISSSSDEKPRKDISVSIRLDTYIVTV